MWELILEKQKEKKYLIFRTIVFTFILSLYIVMDNYGFQNYKMLGAAFGYSTLFTTILLNVLISFISAYSISLSYINYKLMGNRKSGSVLSSIGNIIGLYFSGCASCGLSLISSIGLSIGTPIVTPGALKYKFIALVVVVIGLIWVIHSIKNSKCKVKGE